MKKVKIESKMPLGNQVYFKRLKKIQDAKTDTIKKECLKCESIKKETPISERNQTILNNINETLSQLRSEIEKRKLSRLKNWDA